MITRVNHSEKNFPKKTGFNVPADFYFGKVGRDEAREVIEKIGFYARDCMGATILHHLVELPKLIPIALEIMDEKIKNPALIEMLLNIKDIEGNTPLHRGIEFGHDEFRVRIFLERGANPWEMNKEGNRPIHIAAGRRWDHLTELIEFIKEEYPNRIEEYVNSKNGYKETPLHIAIKRGCLECVKILINNGADTRAEDILGDTPIKYAIRWLRLDVAKEVISILVEGRALREYDPREISKLMEWARLLGKPIDLAEYIQKLEE